MHDGYHHLDCPAWVCCILLPWPGFVIELAKQSVRSVVQRRANCLRGNDDF